MCGIVGVVSAAQLTSPEHAVVRAMNQSMVHRGPDGSGEYVQSQVMLAMRRLSIIDLAGGWQPLYNEDRTLALVANGEVYNHVELGRDLAAKGHRFATGSDCEKILHLYEDHDLNFVHHLRGMYACALWDSIRRRLILVRDRMGEKPLYLFEQPGRIWFGSELRTMLASGQIPFKLDPGAINLYFHYGYVPDPRTPIVGLRKLPAGHLLVIDVDPWKVEQRRYWNMEDAPAIDADPVPTIKRVLDEIGEIIIRSDVPVGVALSGGLDSSVVAAIAASKSPGKIRALSVGYKGRPRQDERDMAKGLADKLQMPFLDVEISPDEVIQHFADIVELRDDPIADSAGYGYWAVSKLARDSGIPVLLKGHGGDELFWGYSWVRRAAMRSITKNAGRSSFPADFCSLFPRGFNRNKLREYAATIMGFRYGWRPFRPDAGTPDDQFSFYNMSESYQMGAFLAQRLYTPRFAKEALGEDPAALFRSPRPWKDVGVALTRLICDTYLIENGMAQGDRLSMAHSVELRLPLCDYKLVETVVGLRKARPDHDLGPKAWMKAAVRDMLPPEVLDRAKRGFTPPAKQWQEAVLSGHGNMVVDGYLVQNGIIAREMAQRMAVNHPRLSPWESGFMTTLVLEHWCRRDSTITGPAKLPPVSDVVSAKV